MYADDTQLIEYTTASDIPNAIMKLQNCVESIHERCRSRRLQIKSGENRTDLVGSKASLKKTVHIDLNLNTGTDIIKPVDVVRDHVRHVCRSCFYQLRQLRVVRRSLTFEASAQLVHAFINSRLDYCNSLLAGVGDQLIGQLQSVLRAAGPTGSTEEEIRSHLRWHSKQVTLASDPAANLVKTLFACFPLLARWSPSIPLGDALSCFGQWCAAIASFGGSWWSHHTANIHQDFRPSWVCGLWTDCVERTPTILEKQRSVAHSLQI